MSDEPPQYVAYQRTGVLGGIAPASLSQLQDVALARKLAMTGLMFGLVGITVTLGIVQPFDSTRMTLAAWLSSIWFPLAIGQALSAYLHYSALEIVKPAGAKWYEYRTLLAFATSLVPLGSVLFPMVTVLLADRYFKRRSIWGYFWGPKTAELVHWVETFGGSRPPPPEVADGR